MKKRQMPILAVIGILIISGFGAGVLSTTESKTSHTITQTIVFSKPTISYEDQYTTLTVLEAKSSLHIPGNPEVPMVPYTVELPFSAYNVQIQVEVNQLQSIPLSSELKPAASAVIDGIIEKTDDDLIKNLELYQSNEYYPETWYTTKISVGLSPKQHRCTYATVYLYPVRYQPQESLITSASEMTITITYDSKPAPKLVTTEYEMIIITPEIFLSEVEKLVDHKNSLGLTTTAKTVESIYAEYTGVDEPEEIKLFIKDAIEMYNTSYILLIGGLNSFYDADDRDGQSKGVADWHLPVRYTNIVKTGSVKDPGAISDLYYADIYRYNESSEMNEFDNWDSNGNGIFAEWSQSSSRDTLDLIPDVYLGRLPCRKKFEVRNVVKKIIKYESSGPADKSWYTTMVGIGGLSHALYNGTPDGEYLCDLAFSYMDEKIDTETKIYSSNNNTGGLVPLPKDIIKGFNTGSGFLLFEGHGHPLRWDTHPVEGTGTWFGGLHLRDMWKFFNRNKLPFVVVGGCHNGQFNVSWYKTLHSEDYGDLYWTHNDPGTECFSWRMVALPYGGAIASVGATGLTVSWSGNPDSLNGRINMNIFYLIGQEEVNTPGQALAGSVEKFILEEEVQITEAHSITIVHLFGDPSLQFGGIS